MDSNIKKRKIQLELFTYNMDTNAYLDMLKKYIKALRKMDIKKLVLVRNNTPNLVSNKAKEFYLKNENEK